VDRFDFSPMPRGVAKTAEVSRDRRGEMREVVADSDFGVIPLDWMVTAVSLPVRITKVLNCLVTGSLQ